MENLRRERAEFQSMELLSKHRDMGANLNLMFWIKIAGIIITIAAVVVSLSTLMKPLMNRASDSEVVTAANSVVSSVIITAALLTVIEVIYGILVMMMGKVSGDYTKAGIYYIIHAALYFLYNFTSFSILQVASAVLEILFVLKFAYAMYETFYSVDSILAMTWEKYRSFYAYLLIAMAACYALAMLPFVGFVAIFVLPFVTIGSIVVKVWELILLYRSAVRLKTYIPSKERQSDYYDEPTYIPEPEIAPEKFELSEEDGPAINPFVPLGANKTEE